MCLLKNTWNLKRNCLLTRNAYLTATSCVSLTNLFNLPLHLSFLSGLFGLCTPNRKDCLLLCFCTVPSDTATSMCHQVELPILLLHGRAQPTCQTVTGLKNGLQSLHHRHSQKHTVQRLNRPSQGLCIMVLCIILAKVLTGKHVSAFKIHLKKKKKGKLEFMVCPLSVKVLTLKYSL